MSLLSELFSDLFARQDNALARVDSRTKLIVALSMLVAVIFSTTPVFPLAVLVLCVAATAAIGVPVGLIGMRLAAPLGIASVLLVLQSILTGTTPFWTTVVWDTKIAVTQEGFHAGLLIASRVLGSVSVILLLSSVTPAHRVFRAMGALGVPQGWVEIAMLMYRYIFVLLDMTADVTAAQRVRLGYSNARRGLASAGIVAGTVVLRSMDQAVRTNEAMRVRGYRGEIPFEPVPPLARRDAWIIGGVAVALSGIFFAAEALSK